MALALANRANAALLKRMLGHDFHVQDAFAEESDEAAQEIDLIVADTASLQHYRQRILNLRQQAAPMILPVLMVADNRTVLPSRLTAELGHSVDDLLRIPTTQAELKARIDNLLRLRDLSRQQESSRQQLVGVVSALSTLNACDRIVVRSKSEGEMLSSLCRTIVDEEGYNLAWVGFAIGQADKPIEIKAGHFGYEECRLLERLADNLVLGLNALRTLRESQQQSAKIHHLAYTDALTGLPNRRHLVRYLDRMLDAAEHTETSGAVLFIDLDRFKLINDALGHEVGDRVLIQIGQRLQGAVRHADQVIRQGGDEFLVLMIHDPRHAGASTREQIIANACALADRIIAHLAEPLMEGGFTHHIVASIGISLYPDHGRNATLLIENADKAMFEAKRQGGGGQLLFSEDFSTSRQQRFAMESRLREALNNEEFELHYQPIFELDSCRIVAVEALIRWPQADGDTLMPGAFMPVVEETGMIKPLGDWVLETAARQLKAWHEQGFMLEMAVNVSLNQLYPGCIAESFAALVRPHVDPRWIHLEVTENALMIDPGAIETLLYVLHAQGFQLAIDDFGTGYSSLSRLQHLSIQTLKIDRSFINELDQSGSKGAALVSIIQQMAASLNLHTIAEGIETDAQRRVLLETAGADGWGQGFWFSPGVPAHELEARLENQQASRRVQAEQD
ncbi:putative bifunctional diguanylate cyclase/phosphodiesterase [Halomonas korlensis]|nr:EAL domain-containing protein [Halomonas korlensis]